MEPSLTVVLPIHNAERSLQQDVGDVLEAAYELTPRVTVLIVDDASTDDSYEVAAELANRYPQVDVLRRPPREALQESLRRVRQSIDSDVVIVHDGSSRVNPNQLRLIWRQQQVLGAVRDSIRNPQGVSFADLRRPSLNQPMMESAHRRLWGFQQMAPEPASAEAAAIADEALADEAQAAGEGNRTDEASRPKPAGRGVGAIPSLPRPNVLGTITDFALGE